MGLELGIWASWGRGGTKKEEEEEEEKEKENEEEEKKFFRMFLEILMIF